MEKLFQLEPFTEYGEPRVCMIHGDNTKLASSKYASEATEYIASIKPEEGYTYVLVIAMSAGEYYGCNRNGDAFAERPIPGVVEEGETLKDHYKTFEQYAHVFRHHINKDPNKAIGDVVKAFYNDDMHRVELLLKLDNEKAADIVRRLNRGEFPAVSMGCKIKYDVCSRKGCHNKARTRAEYCTHAMFNMTKIDPHTGEQNFVWNPSPKLFDISFVIKPADKIGFTIKKVAAAHEIPETSASYAEKVSLLKQAEKEFKKLSEIDKYIRGYVAKSKNTDTELPPVIKRIVNNMSPIPEPVCELLSKLPTGELISSLNSQGIHPTGKELITITVHKFGVPRAQAIRIIKRSTITSPASLNLFRFYPELIPAFLHPDWLPTPSNVNKTIIAVVRPLMEKRSNFSGYLYRRAIKPFTGDFLPVEENLHSRLEPLTFSANGEHYVTTRRALETSQDNALERNAMIGLGSALGATGLYKLLSATRLGHAVWPLALTGSALLGKSIYDTYKTPMFHKTDIPINTEITKLSRDSSSINTYVMLANEYNTKRAPIKAQIKEANEQIINFSSNHDAALFIRKLGAGLNPKGQGHKIDTLIKESGLDNYPFDIENIDNDKISDIKAYLGSGLL